MSRWLCAKVRGCYVESWGWEVVMWRGEGGRWLCGEVRVGGGYVER